METGTLAVASLENLVAESSLIPVALATCPELPSGGAEAELLQSACLEQGIALEPVLWKSRAPWMSYAAVLPLGIHDHLYSPSSFRAWLLEREFEGGRLLNELRLLRWNLDKAYLLDLYERGVSMPAPLLRPAGVRSAGRWPADEVLLLRPRWGAHGRGTRRLVAADWSAPEKDVLVQKAPGSEPQLVLVAIDGAVTACLRRRGAELELCPRIPSGAAALATQALAELPGRPLYARLELWEAASEFELADIELIDPRLALEQAPAIAPALAQALRARLEAGPRQIELPPEER